MISQQSFLVVNVLDAAEMDRSKDLSDFGKGHIVMARWLGSEHLWQGKPCGMLLDSDGENMEDHGGPRSNKSKNGDGFERPRLTDAQR